MERISFDQVPQQPVQAPVPTPSQPTTASLASSMKTSKGPMNKNILLSLAIGVVVLGLGTGYVAARMTASTAAPQTTLTQLGDENAGNGIETVKVGQVVGAQDSSSFKDAAEGVLVLGGLGVEGSHHIVRPGGESQNVYLTSSVMDLKMFEGHKVKIWGETMKGQKAGWLMDVGRLEVLELNAQLPDGAKVPAAPVTQD